MSKIILHIDLNAFFVTCEIIKNPTLKGKPVIIGHLGRAGIVSTCSYEARKQGVSSGMPTFKAVQLCKNAIILPVDYNYYQTKSHEFFNFVNKYATKIEMASIDECFVDMSDELKKVADVTAYLRNFQNELLKQTGLMCSIGVAPTKFLAKMASDMQKPLGLTIIRRKDVRKMIDPLPIEDFFGIGKKTSPRLRQLGINTIGDLAKRINDDNDYEIKKELGKFSSVIKEWINGYGDDNVEVEPYDPKSIGMSHTLNYDTNDFDELKNQLVRITKEVCSKAKYSKKIGTTVQIVLKDNNFKVINRSKRLEKPTNKQDIIINYVIDLLEQNYDDSRMIRLVGVTLQNLLDEASASIQMSIFDDYETIKEEYATTLLINELNRKMNKKVFKTASEQLMENKNGIKCSNK